MAVLQSSFVEDIPVGYPGMEADGELSNIITRTLESGTVGFGKAVYQGTADRGAVTTPSANLLGFTIANKTLPVTADRAADTFVAKDNLRIKNRGKIWVLASVAVTPRQPVYVTSAGAITNVSTGNTAAAGWEFDDTAASGAPVRIVRR
ncbi:MAG: hypothetical protein DI555_07000 [Novosphingobium pentaromativorans]|uniref:DUF2190 domain-containing protein n=1 Tax=Novosphingobium pentaromativorans TaxID=205844 RepID=A0A2W5QDW0_9SPHN|nr:MAG: hypothetical protein DI555_07000 [Novosphingobium pentaromativorans]